MIEILPNVHHMLEDCLGVGETEWYHFVLEMSIVCQKGHFPLDYRLDAYQIVGSPNVDIGEYTLGSKSTQERRN